MDSKTDRGSYSYISEEEQRGQAKMELGWGTATELSYRCRGHTQVQDGELG